MRRGRLTEEEKKLLTPIGFMQAFFKNLQKTDTFVDAYELTEDQHEKAFGKRKYTSYNSFQTSKKRYLGKIKRNS